MAINLLLLPSAVSFGSLVCEFDGTLFRFWYSYFHFGRFCIVFSCRDNDKTNVFFVLIGVEDKDRLRAKIALSLFLFSTFRISHSRTQ